MTFESARNLADRMGSCTSVRWGSAVLIAVAAIGCSDNSESASGDVGAATPDLFEFDSTLFDVINEETETSPPEDTTPAPGSFGAPCKSEIDCDSGICIDSAEGKVCSKVCDSTCPIGYKCLEQTLGGGDALYICVPRFKRLCDPCFENTPCNGPGETGNLCVPYGPLGNYCGADCDPMDPQCPENYECGAMTDPITGYNAWQCMRAKGAGICSCSLNAKIMGLKTACTNKNPIGACTGERLCTMEGLSACGAPIPEEEICDGKDNNCNGKTDDFDVSASCTKKNEFGECKGKLIACNDGVAVCDAPDAKPENCNGLDDDCDGKTDNNLCEDGDPCTNGVCNTDGSCKQVELSGTPCNDGSICTQTDGCVSGKCFGGNALPCDDNDPCTTDACDPFTGCTHTPASDAVCTNDGNACTQDICQSGKCAHPPAVDGGACPEDGKPCTADICNNGQCIHPFADGLKCQEDGKPCTDDVCQAGSCVHINGTSPCDDGNACTEGDTCSAGKCVAGKLKACNDGNACTSDSCNPAVAGGCVYNNNTGPCVSTSLECPMGVCSAGSCFPKPNETCMTEIETDLCKSDPIAGKCTAAGKCVVTQPPPQYTCPGCNGLCMKCFGIQLCMPIG
jgi:hypothetical protein